MYSQFFGMKFFVMILRDDGAGECPPLPTAVSQLQQQETSDDVVGFIIYLLVGATEIHDSQHDHL